MIEGRIEKRLQDDGTFRYFRQIAYLDENGFLQSMLIMKESEEAVEEQTKTLRDALK